MNKRIYHLDKTCDSKIIGPYYPQCKGLVKEYDNETKNSMNSFSNYKGRKVEFIPNLDGVMLYKSAKLTDVISCGLGPGNDLIISNRFAELLKNFNTSPIQYFNCAIYKGESKYQYTWLHFLYELEKKVDYQKSILVHPDNTFSQAIKHIKNYEDYKEFSDTNDKYGFIKSKKVVIENINLDLFVIGQFNQKVFISERLKSAIIEMKISGIDLYETDEIKVAYK